MKRWLESWFILVGPSRKGWALSPSTFWITFPQPVDLLRERENAAAISLKKTSSGIKSVALKIPHCFLALPSPNRIAPWAWGPPSGFLPPYQVLPPSIPFSSLLPPFLSPPSGPPASLLSSSWASP